jgi:polyhydroxyalkanoate synthesis regulator phasin
MQKEYGIDFVDQMIDESKKLHKEWSKKDYQKIIDTYTERIIEYSKKLTV